MSSGLEKLRMTGAGSAIAALTSGGDAQGQAAADALITRTHTNTVLDTAMLFEIELYIYMYLDILF